MIRLQLVFFAACIAAGFVLDSRAAEPDEAVLRIAINSDIRSTNAGVSRDFNTDIVLHQVLEPLVTYDGNLDIVPMLAAGFAVSEDGRSYTFRLREGLRFHNGESVTAQHVQWSWNRYLDEETGWLCRRTLVENSGNPGSGTIVENISVVDPLTVRFELRYPSALFLHHLANTQCIGGIIHPDSVGPDGEWLRPVGTGPYRLKEWRRGEFIDLEKFDRYLPRQEAGKGLGGAKIAHVDTVRFQIVPDAFAATAMLIAGAIDVLPAVSASGKLNIERRASLTLLPQTSPAWNVLLLQTEDELLSDVRMRRAIAHALDIDVIADATTFGAATGNPSAVFAGSRFHTAVHAANPEYDPDRARQLLAQAGYRGEKITLQTSRRFPEMFDQAIAVQAMLHAVGVNVSLQVLDWATHLSNYFNGRFQLSSFGFSPRTDPTLAYMMFVGSKAENPYVQWDSKAATRLVLQSENLLDDEGRQAIFDRLHREMQQQVPIIGLFNVHAHQAFHRTVCGYEPWPLLIPRAWGVYKSDTCDAAVSQTRRSQAPRDAEVRKQQ